MIELRSILAGSCGAYCSVFINFDCGGQIEPGNLKTERLTPSASANLQDG